MRDSWSAIVHKLKVYSIKMKIIMAKLTVEKAMKRQDEIWDELYPQIEGTGMSSLIEELIELEYKLALAEEGHNIDEI